jgi:hypothetical protein
MKEKKKKKSKGYTWNKDPSLLSIFPRLTCGDNLPLKKWNCAKFGILVYDFFLKGNFHQNFELMSTFGDILWKKKVWIRKCLVNVVISKIWRKFPTISKFNQIYTRKKKNLNFLVQKEPKNSGKNKLILGRL